MKTFLMVFEVATKGSITNEGVASITLRSQSKVRFVFKNLRVEAGTELPLLTCEVYVDARTFEAAENSATDSLNECLNWLSVVCCIPFSIHKRLYLADWTKGLTHRDFRQYQEFPGANLPYSVLSSEYFGTTKALLTAEVPEKLGRAARWFAKAVAAEYSDEKLQFLWLTLEIVSQIDKPSEKVNDVCARCKSNLYCESCRAYPRHKPYPKQLIRSLFDKVIEEGSDETFEIANKFRNALMHGDDLAEVERSVGISLTEIVDTLGIVASHVLRRLSAANLKKTSGASGSLAFLETNMYAEEIVHTVVSGTLESRDPENPCPSELAGTSIELVHTSDASGIG